MLAGVRAGSLPSVRWSRGRARTGRDGRDGAVEVSEVASIVGVRYAATSGGGSCCAPVVVVVASVVRIPGREAFRRSIRVCELGGGRVGRARSCAWKRVVRGPRAAFGSSRSPASGPASRSVTSLFCVDKGSMPCDDNRVEPLSPNGGPSPAPPPSDATRIRRLEMSISQKRVLLSKIA